MIYGTSDLDAAARRVEEAVGVAAVAGGRHEGLGTHNQIVPLTLTHSIPPALGISRSAAAQHADLGQSPGRRHVAAGRRHRDTLAVRHGFRQAGIESLSPVGLPV